ncbi:MAG: hypothetical protein K5752_00605 [Succinivibrionaceae bacterium]|nr:hypothetical protein [Succinivibrionaceae bacterium]
MNWLLSVIPSVRPKSNLDNLRKLLPWSPDVRQTALPEISKRFVRKISINNH